MLKALPKVTIVTVVFNNVGNIEATIQSVINQTYPVVEYIVIDGGSRDGTVDIIKRYGAKITCWISEPDKGIYDAMNKGIDFATGEWIIFMNTGDRFFSSHTLSEVFNKKHETDVLYGNAIIEYPSFETSHPIIPLHDIWKRMPFCHQSCFVKASLLKEIKFDLRYKISADYNLIYTLFLNKKKFVRTDVVICYYDYKTGVSKNLAIRSTKERKQIVLQSGFTFRKWLYYSMQLGYLKVSLFIKTIIGEKGVARITRLLRA